MARIGLASEVIAHEGNTYVMHLTPKTNDFWQLVALYKPLRLESFEWAASNSDAFDSQGELVGTLSLRVAGSGGKARGKTGGKAVAALRKLGFSVAEGTNADAFTISRRGKVWEVTQTMGERESIWRATPALARATREQLRALHTDLSSPPEEWHARERVSFLSIAGHTSRHAKDSKGAAEAFRRLVDLCAEVDFPNMGERAHEWLAEELDALGQTAEAKKVRRQAAKLLGPPIAAMKWKAWIKAPSTSTKSSKAKPTTAAKPAMPSKPPTPARAVTRARFAKVMSDLHETYAVADADRERLASKRLRGLIVSSDELSRAFSGGKLVSPITIELRSDSTTAQALQVHFASFDLALDLLPTENKGAPKASLRPDALVRRTDLMRLVEAFAALDSKHYATVTGAGSPSMGWEDVSSYSDDGKNAGEVFWVDQGDRIDAKGNISGTLPLHWRGDSSVICKAIRKSGLAVEEHDDESGTLDVTSKGQ